MQADLSLFGAHAIFGKCSALAQMILVTIVINIRGLLCRVRSFVLYTCHRPDCAYSLLSSDWSVCLLLNVFVTRGMVVCN